MNKIKAILISFFFITNCFAQNQVGKNGVGVVIGEPTGATVKYWKNKDRALDAGLAFSFNDFMIFYSDYLFQFKPINEFSPYAGIGGVILFSTYSRGDGRKYYGDKRSDTELGLRIPVGVEWLPATLPIGIFGEITPGIGLIPDVFGFLQVGVGARYYF